MDYSKLSNETLKALKEGKPLDYTKLSNDELAELKTTQKTQEPEQAPISKTESGLRGAAQGASLGFADEITGALESLLSNKSYQQSRDESRQAYKMAEQENPATYFASTLLGGIATPIPFGGAKTIGQAALTGARLGAIGGLGAGEADLTQGDIGGAIEETARGAGIGAAATGALSGLGSIGRYLGKTDAGKAFKEGLKGNYLVGKEARQKLGNELVEFAGKTGEDIQGQLSQAARDKMGILKAADEAGQKLDVTDLLNKTYPEELANLQKSYSPESDAARNALATRINRAKGTAAPSDELSTLMNDIYPAGTAEKTVEKFEMSPSDIDSFRRALGRLGYEADLKDDQVIALAKRLSGKVGEKVNTEVAGVGDLNAKIQNLIEAQDVFNIGGGLDELGNQTKLTPLLQRLESDTVSSDVARSKFDKGIQALKEANPEMGTQIEQTAKDLAERYTLARDINKPLTISREGVKRIATMLSNPIGYAAGKIGASVPVKIGKQVFNITPNYLSGLASKLEAKGSKFAPVLKNIVNESEPKRKAIMFSLMQQPAFRQAIESGEDDGQ